ncbi:glycosyltransferase family 2 protein [Celeribacter naphthalenivorans]|uniref:glycosyltransferase family 2 protein n=1 Tax=Celeribacter naphthalenivorans TaxID=1614694 RepID=UPI001CF94D14|nr:glycosyltransferase family 2 protein [Celeribacter naphthalenivorans]
MRPAVTIIMPVFNSGPYLPETLEAVIAQSHENWTLLAIDDKSSDDSAAIVARYAATDPRIRLLSHTDQKGAAAARNSGLEAVQTSWIAFLDADDIWTETKLATQLTWLERQGHGFGATSYGVIDRDGRRLATRHVPPRIDYTQLLRGNPIGTSTVMIHESVLNGLRFPDLRRRQDYALWLQLAQRGVVCHGLDTPLTLYRRRPDALSAAKLPSALATRHVYRTLPNLSRLGALKAYSTYLWRTGLKHLGWLDY